jgi:hypothetical protein
MKNGDERIDIDVALKQYGADKLKTISHPGNR